MKAMDSTHQTYPVRLFIRHKARMNLVADLQKLAASGHLKDGSIDETLFADVIETFLQSESGSEAYQPCDSRHQALLIEDQLAQKIAETYLQIMQKKENALVQKLNNLL